jgi:hypothetical protein
VVKFQNNHSYPNCLLKQWAHISQEDKRTRFFAINKSDGKIFERYTQAICCEKGQYNNYTEAVTANDDASLLNDIKSLAELCVDKEIQINQNFLCLIFRLMSRTKSINKLYVNGTLNSLGFLKSAFIDKKLSNGMNAIQLLKQIVNQDLLVKDLDTWKNVNYQFYINHTSIPFVFSDDVTKKMILSLSPSLAVSFTIRSKDVMENPIEMNICSLDDEEIVNKINDKLFENATKFIGSNSQELLKKIYQRNNLK